MKPNQPLGGAKVRYLDLSTVHVDKDIVSLDISVDNALVVKVLDPLHNLFGIVANSGLVLLQWAPLELE